MTARFGCQAKSLEKSCFSALEVGKNKTFSPVKGSFVQVSGGRCARFPRNFPRRSHSRRCFPRNFPRRSRRSSGGALACPPYSANDIGGRTTPHEAAFAYVQCRPRVTRRAAFCCVVRQSWTCGQRSA